MVGCDWVEWDGEEDICPAEGRDIEAQRAMWLGMEESFTQYKKDKREFDKNTEGFIRKREATTVAEGSEWSRRLRKL